MADVSESFAVVGLLDPLLLDGDLLSPSAMSQSNQKTNKQLGPPISTYEYVKPLMTSIHTSLMVFLFVAGTRVRSMPRLG
jgi:hypothetical protein